MKKLSLILLLGILPAAAFAVTPADTLKKSTEQQIRNLLDPVFSRYCAEECRILGIDVKIDLAHADEAAPGFEDVDPRSQAELGPVAAEVKLLLDEKLGPTTRARVLSLATEYMDGLDYPVRITPKLTKFPSPAESATRVSELRERISKQFRGKLDDLIAEYCPHHCLLSDYDLQTELVNLEEAQFGNPGEYFESSGVALRVRNIGATILMDESIPADDQKSLIEMARMKANSFKNVTLSSKSMRFPRLRNADGTENFESWNGFGTHGGTKTAEELKRQSDQTQKTEKSTSDARSQSRTDSTATATTTANDSQTLTARETQTLDNKTTTAQNFSRTEKIERVESGDALHTEFEKIKVYGLILACILISMLAFIALAGFRSRTTKPAAEFAPTPVHHDSSRDSAETVADSDAAPMGKHARLTRRLETQHLVDELVGIFAEQPRVAKYVFTRVLTEDGIETAAASIAVFGETVFMDMLRDPTLSTDMNELMEFYARTPVDLTEDEKYELVRKLHNRTTAGKLAVMAARSSHQFDFLAEMDGTQILELVGNESVTVRAIVLTQCEAPKRASIFAQIDATTRLKLMGELSRIDYLPKDYIQNVAAALKRKRLTNPRLNTEAIPGSEVLVNLLERSENEVQYNVMRSLETSNPNSARLVKTKLVSLDTLGYLPDGILLEVILALKHEELLQFLKGTRPEVRQAIFAKSPADLVADLNDELTTAPTTPRETYLGLERKVINRIKIMAQDNLINLTEVNDRMFNGSNPAADVNHENVAPIRKAVG